MATPLIPDELQAAMGTTHFFFVMDAQGQLTEVSDNIESVLGYAKADFLGAYDRFLTPRPENERVGHFLEQAISGHPSPAFSIEMCDASGQKRWLQVQFFPKPNPDEHAGRASVQAEGFATDITVFSQLLEESSRLTQRLERAQRLAKVGIWEYDHVGDDFYCSPGLHAILAVSQDDCPLTMDVFLEFVDPADRHQVSQLLHSVVTASHPLRSEYRLRLRDGQLRHVVGETETLFDAEGNPRLTTGTLQDITDLHLTEKKVSHMRSLLAETESIAQIGSWELELDTHRLHYSKGAYLIHGFEVGREVVLEDVFAQMPENDRRKMQAEIVKATDTGEERELVHAIIREDGTKRWLLQRGVTKYDLAGKPVRLVGTVQDITERKVAEEELYYLAHHDALTGLANRSLFTDLLHQAIAENQRNHGAFAVLFIDLDHFKEINDSLGHSKGDEVIKLVGQRLHGLSRDSDSIARLGGDEFAFLVRDLYVPSGAIVVAEKILEDLHRGLVIDGERYYLSASIGISLFPEDGNTPDLLIRNADAAMYHAKDNERNTYAFYTHEMTQQALDHVQLDNQLRQALLLHQFEVWYQPKYDCQSERIVGSEALIRWQHPEKGLLLPGAFIDEAEKTDLIVDLGEWVLHQACEHNARWHRMGLAPGRVSVNISPKQLAKDRLKSTLLNALGTYQCEPDWVELEIIERFVMSDPKRTLWLLNEIHELGIALSIDDFGTEYSSLTYLKQMPLSTLKIDRAFVKDIPDDPNDMAIVEAMLALADKFQLQTVAEGVETEAQLAFLKDAGADAFQGFLKSRAVPAEQFEALLQAQRKDAP
ncbi:MAG: EAL domain-containing protein [Hydrogenovibrio sp.]|uniref:EAL domain-containing protein n=1 Tax=Hydrogenovibrio sp. TaxID=2065821 RepID=UPI00286FFC27|nr:EAL domain-containing protein [Hydrogenovibrio sp.]MDR9498193.1 EAL domain-containing protein [Hydrogenovibrio sp.]